MKKIISLLILTVTLLSVPCASAFAEDYDSLAEKIIDYMDDGYTRTRKSMNDRFTKSKIYNYQGTHIDIII